MTCTVPVGAVGAALTASFSLAPQPILLGIAKSGAGSGVVTSVPPGVSCGGACVVAFNLDQTVDLLAAPLAGSYFGGFSGGGCDPGLRIAETFAGTGVPGFSGDGGLASAATFNLPSDLLILPTGEMLIADTYNHRIRMIDLAGIVTTVAGTGVAGYSGDGGLATAANLNYPFGIARAFSGDIVIADYLNHRIRAFTLGGNIQTVAGTGLSGGTGDGGLATLATLSLPQSLAVNPVTGEVAFCDSGNRKVRQFTVGGSMSLVAGNGSAGDQIEGPATASPFRSVRGVAFAADQRLYVADATSHRVSCVSGGNLAFFAGTGAAGNTGDGGPATLATFRAPQRLSVTPEGEVLISDSGNHNVRRVPDPNAGIVEAFAGTGVPGYGGDGFNAKLAVFNHPMGLAVSADRRVYIADAMNRRIRVAGTSLSCGVVMDASKNVTALFLVS